MINIKETEVIINQEYNWYDKRFRINYDL